MKTNPKLKEQQKFIEQWAENVAQMMQNQANEELSKKRKGTAAPIVIHSIQMLSGPRAAALDLFAGLSSGALLKYLTSDSHSNARQSVPWRFSDIYVYMNERAVRIECPWPEELVSSDYRLTDHPLPSGPTNSGRWFVGVSDTGARVNVKLSAETPHWLVGGSTGSGKSYAIRAMAWQLAQKVIRGDNPFSPNRLILIDGKRGQGLGPCKYLPNQVAPMATNRDLSTVINALNWAVNEMEQRYDYLDDHYEVEVGFEQDKEDHTFLREFGRIIIFIDEVQELIEQSKDVLSPLRKLLAQGRAAHVHLVLATQHPTADVFKDRTIKPNLTGRIALRTTHAEASRAIIGQSTPRADWLQGKGDAYVFTSSAMTQRVQVCYVPVESFSKLAHQAHPPIFKTWADALKNQPDFTDLADPNPQPFTPEQVAAAEFAAEQGWGRQRFTQWCNSSHVPYPKGKEALRELLNLGREVHTHHQSFNE